MRLERDEFAELVTKIGEWSERNFGNQQGLTFVAPFLGQIEEAQEYVDSDTVEDDDDAAIDGFVFFCDMVYRLNSDTAQDMTEILEVDVSDDAVADVGPWLMKLAHPLLKRKQRIRGMEDYDTFMEHAAEPLQGLLYAHLAMLKSVNRLAFDATLASVLSRDWVAYPETGRPPQEVK